MKWALVLSMMVLASGCSCAPFYRAPDPDVAFTDSGPRPRDVGHDTRELPDRWVYDVRERLCGITGRTGTECREGSCSTGLECFMLPAGRTIQELFALPQGEALADSDYASVVDVEDPLRSAPYNGLAGSLCVQVCDRTAVTDQCGSCATCSSALTQAPVIAAMGGALVALTVEDRTFGDASGICRLDCTYEPGTTGPECPDVMTCDPYTAVCVERCTTDTECNTVLGVTYEGDRVTLLEEEHPATCSPATGRCEHVGTEGASVGDRCTSVDDWAPGVGVCAGGRCGELGCDTLKCGVGGVCLGINAHSTVCVRGCNRPDDCGAGQACSPVPTPGVYSGFCTDACELDGECGVSETCTNSFDDFGAVIAGRCVATCDVVGERGVLAGCAEDEHCRNNFPAEPGWCEPLGGFCDLDDDCGAGQICDELLASGVVADGHCVDACVSDGDCDTPRVCVTSGPLLGLCRQPCVDASECPSPGQICDAVVGLCVEE